MAIKGQPAARFRGQQVLQTAKELTGKGEAAKVMHITWFDPECIWAFEPDAGLRRWHPVSGFSLRG
jgi:hypothetical protein